MKGVLSFAPDLAVMLKWIKVANLQWRIPMVKNILITTLLAFNAIIVFPIKGQSLTDREAIIQSLAGKNIDGKFRWRPKDQNLKKLAKDIIMNKETEFTANGLCLVTSALSGDEFDDFNDSFFLNNLIVSLDLKKLINECAIVRSHLNGIYIMRHL
ncbi:MAG: hypothetical protein IPP37_10930 [Saprospiraceae bacterium]|nr:hypothetical protein [Saprospiraceae bacterium]